jgi:hypothetical protein
MRQKLLLIAGLVLGLAAQGEALADDVVYLARVRVYQEAEISLYPGAYCYSDANPKMIRASQTGFSIFSMHKRLGMPETNDIQGNYNEFAVEGGKPVTVKLKWAAEKNGIKASCGPIASTFYPQAGHDYDITIGYAGNCFVQVRELYPTTQGKAGGKPAPVSPSYACQAG